MWPRRQVVFAFVVLVLAGLAACGRVESSATAPQPQPTPAVPQVVSSGPDASPAAVPAGDPNAPGAVPAGAAATDPASPDPRGAVEIVQEVGPMAPYTDATFRFRLAYPANFALREHTAEALAQLVPPPTAALIVLSPALAASDLGAMELPDLELRVHAAAGATTLEAWLSANDLLPAGGVQALTPFQTAEAAGVELCGDTLIAPGCSYYFLGAGYVYQLIPGTREGEAILSTFAPM